MTLAGAVRSIVTPSPDWPDELSPQQYAKLTKSRPQVKSAPELMDANPMALVTIVGSVRWVEAPSPIWPFRASPQQ
jgi:hypothetical protein